MDNKARQARIAFLLALLEMDGIGRVAAARLFSSFESFTDLARYPEEQIAARLKRVPNALTLAGRLRDLKTNALLLNDAMSVLEGLAEKSIHILTPDDTAWPAGFEHLKPSARSPYLSLFGNADLIHRPKVCLNSVDSAIVSHDLVKSIISKLAESSAVVVLHDAQISSDSFLIEAVPTILLLSSGLSGMEDSVRPLANAVVKSGGLLVSPFDLEHRKFNHETEYLYGITNALSDVSLFAGIPFDDPLYNYMLRLTEFELPVFAIEIDSELPDGIHPVTTIDDAWWIVAALNISDEDV